MASRKSGAVQTRSAFSQRLKANLINHYQTAVEALARLLAFPGSSFMTIAVIGIALVLPGGLFVALENLSTFNSSVENTSQITLYLHENVSGSNAKEVSDRLLTKKEIDRVEYISSEDALEEFKNYSGFGAALNELSQNPLPAVLVIYPGDIEFESARTLLSELELLPEVEIAQLDLQWIQRLNSFLALTRLALTVLGLVFSLAVLFVVGNTIRLAIENRRAEIVIIKLVGGTNSFVSRPFLYTGFWYGFGGGVFAWLLLLAVVLLFRAPVDQLVGLYGGQYTLQGLDFLATITLLLCGGVLGWVGAWISVLQHLNSIEPS